MAEIVEMGSPAKDLGDSVHYALETGAETTVYGSLEQAMRAAEHLGSVAPQTSDPKNLKLDFG